VTRLLKRSPTLAISRTTGTQILRKAGKRHLVPRERGQNLIRHMSSVWVEVLGQPGGNDDSVAALWGFWLIRISLDQAIVRVAVDRCAAVAADQLLNLNSRSGPHCGHPEGSDCALVHALGQLLGAFLTFAVAVNQVGSEIARE
jgi:hypothetical protein